MTDSVALANLAITVLGKTTEALTGLRERAQRSKDADIKDGINTLFDSILQLKDVVSRLLDENKKLQQQIENEHMARAAIPKIRQVGDTNYYFQGDEGPFCQACRDGKSKDLVKLLPLEHWNGGERRECPVCHEFFYEKRMDFSRQRSIKPFMR